MVDKSFPLVDWSSMRRDIEQAKDIDELSLLSDKLEAVRVLARQSKQSLEVQNQIAEYRLRVERKKGEWLQENVQHQGGRPDEKPSTDSRVKLKELGISWDDSSRAQRIAEMPPEKFEEFIQERKHTNEEITLGGVVTEAKKIIRGEKIEKQREELETNPPSLPTGTFDVIVIDPPWHFGDDYNPVTRRGTVPYPTLPQEKLKELDIPAHDNCVLWLWTTNTHIRDAFELLEAWGFAYKTVLTWNKVNMGVGRWLRNVTEHCLLAVKGSPLWDNTTYTNYVEEKRGEHSAKPEAFYAMVKELCPGRKLDYFARKKREGWEVFGDEL